MMRRQKGKHHKRLKGWHRGRGEARRWKRARVPDVDPGGDPTSGGPRPIRRGPGKRVRGDRA